jgi:hypothetical protein
MRTSSLRKRHRNVCERRIARRLTPEIADQMDSLKQLNNVIFEVLTAVLMNWSLQWCYTVSAGK